MGHLGLRKVSDRGIFYAKFEKGIFVIRIIAHMPSCCSSNGWSVSSRTVCSKAATMKRIFPDLRSRSDEQLRSLPVKNYALHGLEDVTYDGSRFFEIEKQDTIGRNIATISADIHLAQENGSWVIVGWIQRDSDRAGMEYFQDIFSRQEKAEKRYGTANLAKWDGL